MQTKDTPTPPPCDGRCCPFPFGTAPRHPFGVCYHGRDCTWHHTREDAKRGDRLRERSYTYAGHSAKYQGVIL